MLWISWNTTAIMENVRSVCYYLFSRFLLFDQPDGHVYEIALTWTSLVFFAATQDIAVDGWALTLLSEDAKPYASTAQTIGLNTGYFASYTVFLAFNSESFSYVFV
jgi:hypothetical protein